MYLAILQWIGIVFSFPQSELPYLGIVTIYLKIYIFEREMHGSRKPAGRMKGLLMTPSWLVPATIHSRPSIHLYIHKLSSVKFQVLEQLLESSIYHGACTCQ
jgi:hypothetical protein